jgi:alpha-N-acetylglucosaminidase
MKIKIYEYTFGHENFKLSTPNLFYLTLKDIPDNCNILDFGCGSGTCYKNKKVINIIIEKKLKITGLDINSFEVEEFKKNIKNTPLENILSVKSGDIFNEIFNEKFDYVIFSESAPLLENLFLIKLIAYMKNNLLTLNGKICFINNLVKTPQFFVSFIKPKLKYITTLDFGRVLTADDFYNYATANKINVKFQILESMSIEEIAIFFRINFIYKIAKNIGFTNYDVEQYKITME